MKTVKVEYVKELANGMLQDSPDDGINYRNAIIEMIENILMHSKNYNGFQYLDSKDMEKSRGGTTVGIRSEKEGKDRFEDTDHTRVKYF